MNKVKMDAVCLGEKPSYANSKAAGLDIRSNNQVYLKKGEAVEIETNLKISIPSGHFGMLVARSGLSYKHQIKLINDVGIIDEDYRGYIGVKLINEGKEDYLIEVRDRVAQLILVPYVQAEISYVDELDETDRGTSGFGSTDKENSWNREVEI